MKFWYSLFFITLALLISGCDTSPSGPAQAVETYLTALAEKNVDQLVNASCRDWEESARLELDSFAAVTPKLNNVTCQDSGQEDETIQVVCDGQLSLDYDGEVLDIDLSGQVFRVVQEDGDWRMCGYK
jgi:hypothetical protein